MSYQFNMESLPIPEVTSSFCNSMPISPDLPTSGKVNYNTSFESRIENSRNNTNNNNNQILLMQKLMLEQQQNRYTNDSCSVLNNNGASSFGDKKMNMTMPITKNVARVNGNDDVNNNDIEQNLIMVCNSVVTIDDVDECDAMICMIQKCVRDDIWPDIKFLSDNAVRSMTFHDRHGFEKSVIGKLLHRTRQRDLNLVQRIHFWKKYSGMVQKKLNDIKTTRTKSIKDEILKGTY
jgi:hypothetical protein